jgi:phosphate transport system substrate-binding protein
MVQNPRFRIYSLALAVLGLALAGACNSSSNQSAQNGNKLIGAGSTFINPIITHWIADFQSKHPGVQINYQSIGREEESSS